LKAETAAYAPPVPAVGLVGATYERGADVQVVQDLGLPFAFGWPRRPIMVDLGETSSVIYRRVLTEKNSTQSTLDARIAVHPCKDLAACLAERGAFDKEWTTAFKTDACDREGRPDVGDGAEWFAVHADDDARLHHRRSVVVGRRDSDRPDRRGTGRPADPQRHLAPDPLTPTSRTTPGKRSQVFASTSPSAPSATEVGLQNGLDRKSAARSSRG